jgi:AraC-like DNA-binding protein
MSSDYTEIQSQFCSPYDVRKLCSYDIETISGPTKPLIHQAARFLYFQSGRGIMEVNGVPYQLAPDTLAVIIPWETSVVTQVDEPLQFIKVIFNYTFINRFLRNGDSEQSASFVDPIASHPVLQLSAAESRQILAILDSLREECGVESVYSDNPNAGQNELTDLLLGNKVAELILYYCRYLNKEERRRMPAPPAPDRRPEMFRYIYSHLSDYNSVDKLTEIFGFSREEIDRYLTRTTGLSLSSLILRMRLEKTASLLIYTDLPLTDIAYMVGYNDASHLSKSFESYYHTSPAQFRQVYNDRRYSFKNQTRDQGFEIVSYIYRHYTEDLNVIRVADHFNLSVVDLNRSLLFVTEMNFDELLDYLRINRACQLLLDSEEAVVDIGLEVGYSNVKTFTRHFKKLKDMSPGDFRKVYILQQGGESIPADAGE